MSLANEQRPDCDPRCMAPFGSHHKRCPTTVTDADRAKAAELLKSHRVIAMDIGLDRAIAAALADARAEADQLRDAMRALAAGLAGRGQAELSHPMFAGEGKLLMEIAARVLHLADGGRR